MSEAVRAANPGSGAPLLRDANFLRLWAALSCNAIGYEISALAIPLAAAVLLQASVMQMSVLKVMELLPPLLFVLPGGALVDRLRSKPLLLARAVGEALALAMIPAAYLLGHLHMGVLCASVFALAAVSGLFSAAEPCFINAVLGESRLLDGYSKIQGAAAVAQALAPGLAGVLVQCLAAPLALLADASLALAGAALLWGVNVAEARTRASLSTAQPLATRAGAPMQLRAPAARWGLRLAGGIGFVWRSPPLRSVIVQRVLWLMIQQPVMALLFVYAVRVRGLDAGATGAAFLACGAGGVAAALLAERLWRAVRIGVRMAACAGVACAALLAMLAAAPGGGPALPLLAGFLFIFGFANTYLTVHYAALRGALTPPEWQGRVFAAATLCGLALTAAAVLAAGAASTLAGVPAVLAALAVTGGAVALLSLLRAPRDARHASGR